MSVIVRACVPFVVAVCASCASAQWWWPPQNGVQITPACPSPSAVIDLKVGGTWNDSCRPNEATVSVSGADVDFVTERVPPPGVCLAVLTPWSLTRSVGPLPAGTYSVYATHVVAGQVVHPRTLIGSFDVSPSCPGGCYADCNGDGVLGLADFGCFQTKFALGCP
jgi:hypothetical protein